MKEKSKIINDYKNKINTLKQHNHYYYNNDNPKISDKDYDTLKKEILLLEQKNSFLKKLNLLSPIVGASPLNKFKKIQHLRPMLSLSNAFNKEDMSDFIKKIKNFLNLKKLKKYSFNLQSLKYKIEL